MFNNRKSKESKMHHVYMSHEKVLDPKIRNRYDPEKFFHNYRGKVQDYKRFQAQMERLGHSVITNTVRFDFEGKGGPRKLDGVFVDQALTPVPKSEVV